MSKKHFFWIIDLILAVVYITKNNTMPTYAPSRDYIDIEDQLIEQFIFSRDSSVIELPAGHFLLSQSLSIDRKSHLTIRGQGMEETVLSFKGQTSGAEGIKITNSSNIILEDFSVEDAAGDNLKVSETDNLTIRRIRSAWTGRASVENGAYGIYPVLCNNVILEENEAIGASDAGIYVGQSNHVIIRNNKAYYNVAGIESENSSHVEIYGNESFENTSGLLVFNLPGLTTYGNHINVYNNIIHDNNLPNFAVKGSIVSATPLGTGIIILATKDVSVHDNTVKDHKTLNLAIVSYDMFSQENQEVSDENQQELLERGIQPILPDASIDPNYNPYPGDIEIKNNSFSNRFLLPTFSNEFGLLWGLKNKLRIPDIAYDGILADGGSLQDENHLICINESDDVNFVFLDGENDLDGFSNDIGQFKCSL
jgi:parallel beta-helix repeat protein